MEVEIFTFCEYADVFNERMIIVHPVDSAISANIPSKIFQGCLAVRMRFERNEAGKHELLFRFIDPDGKDVGHPIKRDINVEPSIKDGTQVANTILHLNNTPLLKFGRHSLTLSFDGKIVKSTPYFLLPEENKMKPNMN